MWTIIKFDNKSVDTLKQEFFQKLGEESVFYTPKIFVQKYKNNKLVNKEYNLLGEYLFCYHKEFSKSSMLSYLKYTKGLRYFLSGFRQCQDEIKNFILKCKQLENDKGLITHSLFELNIATQYKFKTGPFTDKIFEIINFEKNKINILIGKFNTTINKKSFLLDPI